MAGLHQHQSLKSTLTRPLPGPSKLIEIKFLVGINVLTVTMNFFVLRH